MPPIGKDGLGYSMRLLVTTVNCVQKRLNRSRYRRSIHSRWSREPSDNVQATRSPIKSRWRLYFLQAAQQRSQWPLTSSRLPSSVPIGWRRRRGVSRYIFPREKPAEKPAFLRRQNPCTTCYCYYAVTWCQCQCQSKFFSVTKIAEL